MPKGPNGPDGSLQTNGYASLTVKSTSRSRNAMGPKIFHCRQTHCMDMRAQVAMDSAALGMSRRRRPRERERERARGSQPKRKEATQFASGIKQEQRFIKNSTNMESHGANTTISDQAPATVLNFLAGRHTQGSFWYLVFVGLTTQKATCSS